jgi:hypothetical protein
MLRALVVSTLLALCSAAAMAGEAGRVVFVVGHAQIAARAAAVDAAVQEGDELSTGADGYIYMKTIDDGFLILRPNSKARISAYHVDLKNPANTRIKLELLSGVARSISGAGVKQARQNFRFNTPVAAIGVRGTDFIVYTNQQSSWVSVVSGGVVVSSFEGMCGPEGGGPCEGAASRELFAGRADAMLQVQRGQAVPQLLHSTTIVPELNAPARSDEPSGKAPVAPKVGAAAIGEVNLDPAKSQLPLLANTPAPAPTPPPPVTAPPEVVLPPQPPVVVVPPAGPVIKPPPELMWGRWQSVAELPADEVSVARISAEASLNTVQVGSYVVGRPNSSAFLLPKEGTASFALTGSETTISTVEGLTIAAKVENAHLNVDFSARTYSTGMTVINTLGKVNMVSRGDITLQGALENNSPGVVLRGLLGGAGANEAVYTFKTTVPGDLNAAGVATWAR